MELPINQIIQGDCLEVMKTFPSDSVDCVVTSPPYFGLRDYGMKGQMGLEESPDLYVQKMVELFREVKRVLKKEGTLWLNLGDTYANTKVGNTETIKNPTRVTSSFKKVRPDNLKPKDLIGIPWRVAFALQSDGWCLRQDIIWNKPNPMPESVEDRCTKAHEYVFLLSKSPSYYYDSEAIKEKSVVAGKIRRADTNKYIPNEKINGIRKDVIQSDFANKRSVWTVATKPYNEAHFATFPEKLIEPMILAGCPEGGIVLDPFIGAGTTGLVARKLNRNYVGIELNPDYIKIASPRINSIPDSLFKTLTTN